MIMPVAAPDLFSEPYPAHHPWARRCSRVHNQWETQSPGMTRVHFVYSASGCTACRRGIACKWVTTRITQDWRRATCTGCIANTMRRFDPLGVTHAHVAVPSSFRGRLARAISWWRMCGATARAAPGWIDPFFAQSDVTYRSAVTP